MRHTELTDELQQSASLFAAGAMTASERQEYQRHLEEDGCAVCREEVNELQSAISLLAYTLPSATPSPDVKTRVLAEARKSLPQPAAKRPSAFGWPLWAAASLATISMGATFYLVRVNTELERQKAELNDRIAQLEIRLVQQQNSIAMLTSAGVRVVDLAGQGPNAQASARIFWDQQRRRWLFYVHGLPAVPADKSYQLWFVPAAGNPLSASVFNTDANGSAVIEITVPDAITSLKAAAVTTEPAGGLPQPSGAFALLGAM
jgi:anti-sigma-K factor RskA